MVMAHHRFGLIFTSRGYILMNIFVLDTDQEKCAKYHCDSHVVKMILETAQILSTAIHLHGVELDNLYRPTHKNHPCVKWAAETRSNFLWLCTLGEQLHAEYHRRYHKFHKSAMVIRDARSVADVIPEGPLADFVLTMPDEYKSDDPVESYRNYYRNEKQKIAKWRHSKTPDWWSA